METVDINGVTVSADFEFYTDAEASTPDENTINNVAPESTEEAMREAEII